MATETQTHTPGDWRASSKMDGVHVLTADGVDFAAVEALVPNAEGEANAQLMAAAKALLKALVRYVDCDGHEDEIKEQAEAAIKEATA